MNLFLWLYDYSIERKSTKSLFPIQAWIFLSEYIVPYSINDLKKARKIASISNINAFILRIMIRHFLQAKNINKTYLVWTIYYISTPIALLWNSHLERKNGKKSITYTWAFWASKCLYTCFWIMQIIYYMCLKPTCFLKVKEQVSNLEILN